MSSLTVPALTPLSWGVNCQPCPAVCWGAEKEAGTWSKCSQIPSGPTGPAQRVAVKHVVGQSKVTYPVQQQDAMLKQMAGRPYAAD